MEIINERKEPAAPGEVGEMVLYPKAAPQLRLPTSEFARLEETPCRCGCAAPRIMDFEPEIFREPDILALGQELQKWTSVLDCRIRRGECGLEIDIVAFPGEKLPKLPSAARLNIQYVDLEKDEPFWYDPSLTNPALRY